ncbi:MAG: right-handed parallel beta-helix repeat-containing protein, partial [Planctomycetes bacterium]|nr:right-handed parallel beta-helix repeat-containing protein [Planctomycetota bacterium]
NWTRCGVQGGIPTADVVAKLESFGAVANDDLDDSQALQKACDAAGRTGGAVLIGEGTYYLDRPVTVRQDNVVIRGKGAAQTRLIFRYAIPKEGVVFYSPPANARVGPDTPIELHGTPTSLTQMTLTIDDTVIGTWTRSQHSGNSFAYTRYGRNIPRAVPDGPRLLKGTAQYQDGSTRTTEIPIVLDRQFQDPQPVPDARAAITFAGQGTVGEKLLLERDGRRGDTELHLQSTQGLRAGDFVFLDGPATDRWKKLTRNACLWGSYRNYEAVVTSVSERAITLGQPLRIEFPVVDGSYVQKVRPIQHGGVEDLYLEQTENLWITSVLFSHGWNCWARGVTIKKCGRYPVYGSNAKWCEIRDCIFDDAWFKGGGGTAYTGWDHCWDCLMENVETFKMRHAPLFQWAASGCVIRKSVFHESDAQWHAGWTNENLIEQCVVESVQGHGGYGYGMWASPPEDTAHGPNGPRNVVYNCDMSSPKAGLWMGGMNENWLILHNRFVVNSGPGVSAKTFSFDHIIQGNVFVLQDGKSAMIHLATADCTGIEATGNLLYGGNGSLVSGKAALLSSQGNQVLPPAAGARPQPRVASIYEWQQQHCTK